MTEKLLQLKLSIVIPVDTRKDGIKIAAWITDQLILHEDVPKDFRLHSHTQLITRP